MNKIDKNRSLLYRSEDGSLNIYRQSEVSVCLYSGGWRISSGLSICYDRKPCALRLAGIAMKWSVCMRIFRRIIVAFRVDFLHSVVFQWSAICKARN
ncbi:hypothetical protein Zmor_009870 [Zophobas morio]|uniref:Uncharacterized protein n=1 Tax=Zophobas morio TaxID=2755281 RepID=A0AA38IJM1_9CUCU|nr:hypothetical protein Zmor_009862 [Zophobas morio]KAJ3658112.1 hypothetical protein Zmor_009870 [Zophobas morio]